MANNIPDYMRDFDLNQDYGFTPVSDKPKDDTTPSVDPKLVEGTNLEISKEVSFISSGSKTFSVIKSFNDCPDNFSMTLPNQPIPIP